MNSEQAGASQSPDFPSGLGSLRSYYYPIISLIRRISEMFNYNIKSEIRAFHRQTDIQQQCQMLVSYSYAKSVPQCTFAPLNRYISNNQWIMKTIPVSMKGPRNREIADGG
jgi:hypothetical protein